MKKIFLYSLIAIFLTIGIVVSVNRSPTEKNSSNLQPEKNTFLVNEPVIFYLNLEKQTLSNQLSFSKIIPQVKAENPNTYIDKNSDTEIVAHLQSSLKDLSSDKIINILPVNENNYKITINPSEDFSPGEYKLTTEVKRNNKQSTFSSSFFWGVLAVNFNQSSYKPGQSAFIQMASLDSTGHTLCKSDLLLEITDPQQKTTRLTTKNGINFSGQCGNNNVTDVPDYFVNFQTSSSGIYHIRLTNQDTKASINSFFIADNNQKIVVQRQAATRINPFLSSYKMKITVISQEDTIIDISETVPNDFVIFPSKEYVLKDDNGKKQIIWSAKKIKETSPLVLSYEFDAPKKTPDVFFLGYITVNDWKEPNQWQLASDAPSIIADGTNTQATRVTDRKVIRTTYGSNNNRVFAIFNEGVTHKLYYSDDAEASSPTWNSVDSGTGWSGSEIVWDEANNCLYWAYGNPNPLNSSSADIRYARITNLGTTPTIGALQVVLDGVLDGITYHSPQVEIAQDSGTTKVFVFGNRSTAAGGAQGFDVAVGTINSDNPTWTTYNVKSWTAANYSGVQDVAQSNTNRLIVQYYDGANITATRHDDADSATASSGWDALDGTDNSATPISSDDPTSVEVGSIVGMPATNAVWFSWLDGAFDINTRRWNGTGLDTEMIPAALTANPLGPAITSDGVTLWLIYQNESDNTQLVYQSRSATDGTTAWSGTKTVLEDFNENIFRPSVAAKIAQGKLDVIYLTSTNYYIRHTSSYKISGNVYQEAAGSPYEGTTVWSSCDGSTLNVAISVNGGTKQNTWCSASDGSYYFVLTQPTGSDQDITVFLDTGGGNKGALFTHNNDTITDVTGLSLYKDKIMIRSESSSSISNADINTYDQTNDSDIPIASDGTNVTVDSGFELHINSSETFAPAGNVTTPKLHIVGTYTGASETLTLNGSGSSSSCDNTVASLRPLCIDGGTFTPSSNTTLFSGSTASLIQNATYNILRIEPGGNSITHTLMAGTTVAGGNLTFGNGTNTGVIVTAATNSTTLTANANLTISANTTFIANGSNTATVKGNWTNSGAFTHSSGMVDFSGADSSTQALSGNTTFNNFLASTSGNSAGRTLQFAGSSTTTVSGTWTVTGYSGKVITLQSSDTNAWTINPTAASVTYVSVSRSTNTGTSFCATYSTDGGNNTSWNINTGASCTGGNFYFEGLQLNGVLIN